jgi:hypothetical protein
LIARERQKVLVAPETLCPFRHHPLLNMQQAIPLSPSANTGSCESLLGSVRMNENEVRKRLNEMPSQDSIIPFFAFPAARWAD